MCISKTPSTTLLQISTRKICFPRIRPPFFTIGLSFVSYNYSRSFAFTSLPVVYFPISFRGPRTSKLAKARLYLETNSRTTQLHHERQSSTQPCRGCLYCAPKERWCCQQAVSSWTTARRKRSYEESLQEVLVVWYVSFPRTVLPLPIILTYHRLPSTRHHYLGCHTADYLCCRTKKGTERDQCFNIGSHLSTGYQSLIRQYPS